MSLCKTGCRFFAAPDGSGLCSSCAGANLRGEPLRTPAERERYEREVADAGAARTLFALSEASTPEARRATELYKRFAINASACILTPLDLWTLLEGDGGASRVLLLAKDAFPLFVTYRTREPNGWLYEHVVACRVLDNWNLVGCSANTLGYAGGGSTLAHARQPQFELEQQRVLVQQWLNEATSR